MPSTNQEDLVVDIPDTGDQIDVEIEDTEEESEESTSAAPSEEHESYSKGV